jgi:hypothetical protein
MAKYVVLWTSHKQTIIVSITGGVEKILRVKSAAKGRAGEKSRNPLNEYYGGVIHAIRGAQEVFIFGPAQAKMELKIAILKSGLPSHRVVGTETADRMTERRLVARAREMCGLRDKHGG